MIKLEKLGNRFHYPRSQDYVDHYTFEIDGKEVTGGLCLHIETDVRPQGKMKRYRLTWYRGWDECAKKVVGEIISCSCKSIEHAKEIVGKMAEVGGEEAYGYIWAKSTNINTNLINR